MATTWQPERPSFGSEWIKGGYAANQEPGSCRRAFRPPLPRGGPFAWPSSWRPATPWRLHGWQRRVVGVPSPGE
eukprot:4919817-Lingulodinium_polyedra.AAC.1